MPKHTIVSNMLLYYYIFVITTSYHLRLNKKLKKSNTLIMIIKIEWIKLSGFVFGEWMFVG